jgi:hypothetical protein
MSPPVCFKAQQLRAPQATWITPLPGGSASDGL